jgi:hypothetical protein
VKAARVAVVALCAGWWLGELVARLWIVIWS